MTKTTRTSGTVVRTFADKGFVFIATPEGDVFAHVNVAGDWFDMLEERAAVELAFVTEFNEQARSDRDQFRRTATQIFSVEEPAPLEEFEVLTQVLFFDKKKGFGKIACGASFSKDAAYLSAAVCEEAGVVPGKGMPVRAVIVEGRKGPEAISFEWGMEVTKAYEALVAPEPEVGTFKFFNRNKNFGFIVDKDGHDVHFHLDGVAEDMRKRMRQGKFPKGTTFSFVESKFAGKMTAKIVSLIAIPVKPAVKTEVVAADEGVTPEPVATTKVEATLETEEVAEKAAPKKSAAKKPAAKKTPAKKAAPKKAAPKKAPTKKPVAKKVSEASTDVAAEVASCASSLNGSGAMADALKAAVGATAQ